MSLPTPRSLASIQVLAGPDRGLTTPLHDGGIVIGRDAACDVVLSDEKVSRRHAEITPVGDGQAMVRDLASSNGTFVDGARVERVRLLGPQERLQIGDSVLGLTGDPAGRDQRATVIAAVAPSAPAPALPVASLPGPGASPGSGPDNGGDPARSGPGPNTALRATVTRSLRRAWAVSVAAVVLAAAGVTAVVAGWVPVGAGTPARSVEQLVTDVGPATVLILAAHNGVDVSGGTGWVLDAREGLVVTNHHVINDGDRVRVGVDGELRDADIVATAPCEDLAVLRLADTAGLQAVPLGQQADLRQGQTVVALGYPVNASLSEDLTATTGVVSVVRTQFDLDAFDVPAYPNVVQTDAAINPGNSGGPLLTLDGELVGVNSAGFTMADGQIIQGQSYAIGVDRVRAVTDELREGVSWSWMGLGLEPVAGPIPGLRVTHVVAGTAAADAGLGELADVGAVVTAIDGRRMDGSVQGYCSAVADHRRGDTATITAQAQGFQPVEIDVAFE